MSKQHNENPASAPLYAVIDLGSNSFHMLITRQLADSVQVVDKVKRKVRLASGLDANNQLSQQAIARGLECLSFFAERLQDIPKNNIRIVATATLRLAKNSAEFISQANHILANKIALLSGEQEAQYIYQGVAHTNCSANKRLVIDIGGASTELIVGEGINAKQVTSLDIGCVTFIKQYFADGQLNQDNFNQAISAAKEKLRPLIKPYQAIGWQTVLGGSGTMQALAEVLIHQHQPTLIHPEFLRQIKQQLIACQRIDKISIAGLSSERTPVIASGLAILIAIFECFEIALLQLSSGALREGLLYEMLPHNAKINIRQRTINSLIQRFHVDCHHAENVKKQAIKLFNSFKDNWQLSEDNNYQLLIASCQLHEIGLLLEFKHHQRHSAYIIENAELPGFDQTDKQLLKALVLLYKGDIQAELLQRSTNEVQSAQYLLAILRLAVILCRRRKDDVLPSYQASVSNNNILLILPENWLNQHPLISDELAQENEHLAAFNLTLTIQTS
ncbi:guanosine-5'-triphosphate,3'-diphosphate pyrophosphatase [Thalassotalea insulae]|uniref:Guanosine-5'-triphosphate,3'-diphosphate pyrophosphatase n=1 Tax=Thalassotalea insulae TaxID=2056778 RepID=A0ABQ6GTG1_9GAMM|nr:guanosine-5'-triphosphate,3'-diphosphate pyrophosphatase [Thalassotalea insulae]GLX78444.1 guanosine-5'-triphosphate,3'-diphosphate pyrophosphatase [Thalassotalea insulae]